MFSNFNPAISTLQQQKVWVPLLSVYAKHPHPTTIYLYYKYLKNIYSFIKSQVTYRTCYNHSTGYWNTLLSFHHFSSNRLYPYPFRASHTPVSLSLSIPSLTYTCVSILIHSEPHIHLCLYPYPFRASHTPVQWIGSKWNKDLHWATSRPIENQAFCLAQTLALVNFDKKERKWPIDCFVVTKLSQILSLKVKGEWTNFVKDSFHAILEGRWLTTTMSWFFYQ